jgi:23S rRNA pseudouridine2457 synthase
MRMASLIVFNKPFQVLSQFTDRDRPQAPRSTLADFLDAPQFRAAGRLDYDSEGLLLLTTDGRLQQQIAHPQYRQWKTYWVQVEGIIDQTACDTLNRGVTLRDGVTQPARVTLIPEPEVWPRHPPIRERKTVSDSWLQIAITEGRNRQVRRMTAAVGFPTLRLIRVAIGPWLIDGLKPGEHRLVSTADLRR